MAQGVRKRMKEIAVLDFEGHLIASLREYWASETVATLTVAGPGAADGMTEPPAQREPALRARLKPNHQRTADDHQCPW